MKVKAPTRFQAALLGRALEAPRFSPQRKALWRAVFKQAAATVRHYHLTFTGEELVGYWLDIHPEEVESNSIAIDDILTRFQTIAQESGAVVVNLDSLEEFGDTWQEAPEDSTKARLSEALEWRDGVHPVTDRAHLPRWTDTTCDPDPEAHLEPEFMGFDGFQLCR
jgi:hypothetical protein